MRNMKAAAAAVAFSLATMAQPAAAATVVYEMSGFMNLDNLYGDGPTFRDALGIGTGNQVSYSFKAVVDDQPSSSLPDTASYTAESFELKIDGVTVLGSDVAGSTLFTGVYDSPSGGIDWFQFHAERQIDLGGNVNKERVQFLFLKEAVGITPSTALPTTVDDNNQYAVFRVRNGSSYMLAYSDLAPSVQVSSPSAVPEPATWAMMIVGFGLAGSALRRRTARQVLPL